MSQLTVLSLGAGVQSTTLLLMAAKGEFDKAPDVAIFSDTGWEPKHVYQHLDWLEGQVKGIIPIHRVSKGNIRDDALNPEKSRFASMPFFVRNESGGGGALRRQCTNEYKIQPITRKIREILGVKPGHRVKGGGGTMVRNQHGRALSGEGEQGALD
jgi:3'-phosphoadenosine 5'-phosphosulfate sulfotransferase (PAPS reductase)/FAD synthetase